MDSHTAGRLQKLRNLIAQGEYLVDPDAVADAIVRRLEGQDLQPPQVAAPVRSAVCRPSRARITAARSVGLTRRVRDVLVAGAA